MRTVFHPAASRELVEIAVYYDRELPGLGSDFLNELDRVLSLLAENPQLGAVFEPPGAGEVFGVIARLVADVEQDEVALAEAGVERRRGDEHPVPRPGVQWGGVEGEQEDQGGGGGKGPHARYSSVRDGGRYGAARRKL